MGKRFSLLSHLKAENERLDADLTECSQKLRAEIDKRKAAERALAERAGGVKVIDTDILREWFGGERYARDYEYLDANYSEQANRVVAFLSTLTTEPAAPDEELPYICDACTKGDGGTCRCYPAPVAEGEQEAVAYLSARVLSSFDPNGSEIVAMLFPKGSLRPNEEVALYTRPAEQAVTDEMVDRVLDSAGDYMGEQYGNTALHHPTDRARVKAALKGARS